MASKKEKKKMMVNLTVGEFIFLTEQFPSRPDIPDDYVEPKPILISTFPEDEAIYRLKELKEQGEDLGIDLEILSKTIQGFGFWTNEGRFEKIEECNIDLQEKCFVSNSFCFYYFKDYGKTWVLKEEEK